MKENGPLRGETSPQKPPAWRMGCAIVPGSCDSLMKRASGRLSIEAGLALARALQEKER